MTDVQLDVEADDLVEQITAKVSTKLLATLPQSADVGTMRLQMEEHIKDVVSANSEDFAAGLKASQERINALEDRTGKLADAAATSPPLARDRKFLQDHEAYNPDAIGAKQDGVFGSETEFLRAAFSLRTPRIDPRIALVAEAGDIKADLTGEEVVDGGALVPEEFRPSLLRVMLAANPMRSRATMIPMGSSTLSIPRIRDTDRSDGNLFGGVQTYWLEAGDTIPESQPKFAQVQLVAKALAALTEIQNTTIADSFTSVTALIRAMFGEALNWREQESMLRGDGAGKPLGILESDAMLSLTRKSGGNNVEAEDIHSMEGRLLPGSEQRAVWMIHPGLRKDLGELNLGGVQYQQEDLSRAMPMALNGRPVIANEHCSAPGTAGDIILVDWMYYLIGDRQAMSVAASPHPEFRRNATLVRVIERLDCQPWIRSPITLAQGGADHSVSPFVTLADA